MDCPKCGAAYMISTKRHDIRVDSLPAERKRRYCPACGYRGDFIEIPESLLQTLQKQAHEERVKEEVDKFRAYLAGVDRALGRLVDAAEAGLPLEGPVAIRLRFYRADHRRADADNCEKAIADALNGICWLDDSQIVECHRYMAVDRGRPRVEVEIWKLEDIAE
jgi:Holliday junction resolvase RusA-like endonuclease